MSHLLSLLFLSLYWVRLYGQVPTWRWARSGNGDFEEEAFAVTTTRTGQVIIGGEFYSSTLNLGGITLTNPSASPFTSYAFIAAYDIRGNLLWAQKAGTSDINQILSLASDTAGNIIAAGAFSGSAISFGNFTLSNAGYADAFLAKYDPSGTPLWALSMGGPGWEYAQSVATDLAGNIYLTGRFDSPTLIIGSFTLTNANPGKKDIFLVKLSPQGQPLWAYRFGGAETDMGQAIAVSPTGEIALTGLFSSATLSMGSVSLSNSGQSDVFVAKLDPDGQVLWAQKAGGTDSDMPYGIALTPNGQILVVGTYWSQTITFDNQTLSNQSTDGSNDLFMAAYSPSGQMLWARSAGGSDSESAYAITTDTSGYIYVTGYFASPTISFGGHTLSSSGGANVFVVAYDTLGQPLWAQKAGGTLYDQAYAIATDHQGNLYVSGSYMSSPATFGSHTLPNDQGRDVFVASLGAGTNSISSLPSGLIQVRPSSEAGVYELEVQGLSLPISWRLLTGMGTIANQGTLSKPREMLDLSPLPAGIYLLVLDLPDRLRVWKLFR